MGEDGVPPDERDLLRYELRPLLKRLGLYYNGFGWHAFRRQHITRIQHVGATAFEAAKGAGHSRLGTTFDYTLLDSNREREHVTKLFDSILGMPEGPKQ